MSMVSSLHSGFLQQKKKWPPKQVKQTALKAPTINNHSSILQSDFYSVYTVEISCSNSEEVKFLILAMINFSQTKVCVQ